MNDEHIFNSFQELKICSSTIGLSKKLYRS